MDIVTNYMNEAVEELRHVRWPTRQQAVRLSTIVLGFTLISSTLFGVVDYLLAEVVKFFLSLV
ncbi:preprotein translocase subunit SecE [Candidatus Peregrinibacteria bacterium CG10_big_fil_rev_8_21_14_0_10_49_16]|nr:MAG: preprotein translocase subunit SecE [Candidatus Peregrinibacteria bacterium CG22_combo_CG10-13_8_21_14_all_49_11]PIR52071.1 MAG: preprotein translocase subunit SecE [Candidatus Peregrinibacteria bacterium CG10_big_fil_rev_8_21_14_0_10_49_16]